MATKKQKAAEPVKIPHMVYVPGKGLPSMVRESYDQAHAEATRLALKEPGHQVLVLQVTRQIRGEVVANSLPEVERCDICGDVHEGEVPGECETGDAKP